MDDTAHGAPNGGASTQTQAQPRRTRWVSHGVETLLARLPHGRERAPDALDAAVLDAAVLDVDVVDADVLIVGSGYGGAIAADRLAGLNAPDGQPLRVVLLERGREYLPGAFPSRVADLPGHVRFTTPEGLRAQGQLEGLFDMRIGADMSVLLGNGVGGGSLINAGVMAFPRPEVFAKGWPTGLPDHAALSAHADALRLELGAQAPAAADVAAGLKRSSVMTSLGGHRVPITVALNKGQHSSGGVALDACIACGDCATGCNHGAKNSLDVNLLRRATERGVEIFSGATVTRIRKRGAHWEAELWHTDATLRQRMAGGQWVRAGRIILAAGSLGSTEILLRSQTDELQFSQRLGRGFSGNGDVLATVFDAVPEVNGVADENAAPAMRGVGPTITSMIDLREQHGFVVQDLGVPGPLRRLLEEVSTTASLLQRLDQPDPHAHGDKSQDNTPDPMAVDPAQVRRTLVVAMIHRDTASGVMTPVPDDPELPRDAGLRIDWKNARESKDIERAHTQFGKLLTARGVLGKPGTPQEGQGQLLPNPIWRLLPPGVEQMLGASKGPLLTVHPLGGCGMGNDRTLGVVNRSGSVFDAQGAVPDATHAGLLVLDGAIVPTSLGINPALTIATVADLAIQQQIADWKLITPTDRPAPTHTRRPVFRVLPDPHEPLPQPRLTEVQVIERLSGSVDLKGIGERWVELDLVYVNRPLFPTGPQGRPAGFMQVGHRLPVAVDASLSRLRIFDTPGSRFNPQRPDSEAQFVAPLKEGSALRFFHREASTPSERRCRALWAWAKNRGLRDTWQAASDWLAGRGDGKLNPFQRLKQSKALATRAGEVRLFDYELLLDTPTRAEPPFQSLGAGKPLKVLGGKRFTYNRRGNPWTQLMRMTLTELAGLPLGEQRELEVCPAYFARKRMPLMRVVAQQDQPSALIDQFAFLAYVARVFLNVHLWSFRKPDTALTPRVPQRLPGVLPGLPAPEVLQFRPDGASDDGELRLTAYRRPGVAGTPVVLIHGYSASGTSFAHPVLAPSLAAHLWQQGLEPWVLDLRSSCGMPTADRPYSFEDIALADIPAAIRKVCQLTGAAQVDVVSHCMGSAMLAMTLQAQAPCGPHTAARIRRWVMSQFGPRMRFAPANVLRAYLISYFQHLVPDYRFSLRPGDSAVGVDGNLYDRFVATLPYLNDKLGSEFDLENPLPWRRTPWVGTRHRLDALIGRTFDARRMSTAALDHIDDFFGPINLRTMSQPIHFAQMGEVTDARGLVFGRDAEPLLRHVRMLGLHGQTNGLAHPETAELLRAWGGANLTVHPPFAGRGHQDLLIGNDCAEVFSVITHFLKAR